MEFCHSHFAQRRRWYSLHSASTPFPAIHMSGGTRQFQIWRHEIDLLPAGYRCGLSPSATANGPLRIHVAGQPARTDRRSRGFGSFVAKGQWNPADHSLELDVKMEKSELSDVLSLFEGGQSALLGNIWGDAHLAGPMSKIGITGRLNVSDLHGWNQLPPGGSAQPFTLATAGRRTGYPRRASSTVRLCTARAFVSTRIGSALAGLAVGGRQPTMQAAQIQIAARLRTFLLMSS